MEGRLAAGCDMSCNVNEWTYDWSADGWYTGSPSVDPINEQFASSNPYRTARGGSFDRAPDIARVANRHAGLPEQPYYDFGVRLVLTIH